jgi:hypothetical protein
MVAATLHLMGAVMSSDHTVSLTVVVNGVQTTIDANVNAPLRVVAEHALSRTQNTGRPLSDWEFKDADGRPLDLSRKVSDYHFAGGAVLYLTPTVGVNGAR